MENPQYAQNVIELENIVLENDLQFPELDQFFLYVLDASISEMAQAGKNATLFEVFESAEVDLFRYASTSDKLAAQVMSVIHPYWYEMDERVPANNLMNPNVDILHDWRDGYNHALADFLVANGSVMQLDDGYYGWYDHDFMRDTYPKLEIIAVLNVKEDYWDEFDHTFADDSLHKHGIRGQVFFSNGMQRYMRWEGDIRQAMTGVLGRVES